MAAIVFGCSAGAASEPGAPARLHPGQGFGTDRLAEIRHPRWQPKAVE